MAHKVWATNDVPTAAEVNDYWQEQVNTITTSGSEPGSPGEGWEAHLTNKDYAVVYDGSAWQRVFHWAAGGRTGCRLRRVATQAIADTATTTISWDTEDADSDGYIVAHATTGTTITIPASLGGLHTMHGAVKLAGTSSVGVSTTSHVTVKVVRGGVTLYFTGPLSSDSTFNDGSDLWLKIPALPEIDLAAGDTVEVTLYHNTGSSRNITAWFWLFRTGL